MSITVTLSPELSAQLQAYAEQLHLSPEVIEQGSKIGCKVYLQYLLEHAPIDTLTMAEWEMYWPLVEQELKELDRTPSAEA